MTKVLTERARHGGHWTFQGSLKTGRKLNATEFDADDHGATWYPSARHRQYSEGPKQLSDHLAPVERFLRSRVGKRWDDVHSEIAKEIDKRSTQGNHLWTHIKWLVCDNCQINNGKIHDKRYGWRYFYEVEGLYVHPETGILCWAPKRGYRGYKPKPDPNVLKMDNGVEFRRIDGIWYATRDTKHVIKYRPDPIREPDVFREIVKVTTEKKQLNKKQLAFHKLKNG